MIIKYSVKILLIFVIFFTFFRTGFANETKDIETVSLFTDIKYENCKNVLDEIPEAINQMEMQALMVERLLELFPLREQRATHPIILIDSITEFKILSTNTLLNQNELRFFLVLDYSCSSQNYLNVYWHVDDYDNLLINEYKNKSGFVLHTLNNSVKINFFDNAKVILDKKKSLLPKSSYQR